MRRAEPGQAPGRAEPWARRLAGGIDAWLAAAEARFPDIRPGAEKRVVWQCAPDLRTDWAVLYVHGFSAAAPETRPLPDRVAQALGANLVFTRLAGHGRTGAAMAEASLPAWRRDMAEALAVAGRVGRRVLVIGASTGATLAALDAVGGNAHGGARADRGPNGAPHPTLGGLVLLAPNFRVRARGAALLDWPFARLWLPLLAGRERAFVPRSPGHGRHWTTRYPTVSVLPMAATLRAARRARWEQANVPALFVFDPRDAVVDHAATRRVAARWGGPSRLDEIRLGEGDDPAHHVIAGDILSPGMTDPLVARIVDWARDLPGGQS